MILRPAPSARRHGMLADTGATAPVGPVPAWLRRAVPDAQNLATQRLEDIAIAAGAAIGALDAVVRRRERWAGAWRQRLALAAAAVTARQAGRVEDEAALRDAFVLTRPGDMLPVSMTLGPAGSLLLAWRRLATRPAEELLTKRSLAAVLEEFGHARNDAAISDLADALRQLGAGAGAVGMLTGVFAAAERHGFGRLLGAWLADALLAQRLGWTHAVPLLGTAAAPGMRSGRPRRAPSVVAATGMETEGEWAKSSLAAQARAALRAVDLSAELGRRADRLLAVAPKLRARGADAIIDRLLNEDALVASRGDRDKNTGMSDRALRRLFDRLVELGTVRELSGRPAFRIYGL